LVHGSGNASAVLVDAILRGAVRKIVEECMMGIDIDPRLVGIGCGDRFTVWDERDRRLLLRRDSVL